MQSIRQDVPLLYDCPSCKTSKIMKSYHILYINDIISHIIFCKNGTSDFFWAIRIRHFAESAFGRFPARLRKLVLQMSPFLELNVVVL